MFLRRYSIELVLLAANLLAVLATVSAFWFGSSAFFDRALVMGVAVYFLVYARAPATAICRGGFILLLVAPLLALPAWYLIAQVGPRPILLWWILVSCWLLFSGWALLRGSWSAWRAIAFPMLFLAFALPVPMRIEQPIQHLLQSATTSISAQVLPLLGIPVERFGFILRLPHGELGVIEACSGIRSVSALLAVAALLAYGRSMTVLKSALFLALALPTIITANVGRVIVSGVLLENVGAKAIEGTNHDVLGYSASLIALLAIVCWSQLLRGKSSLSEDTPKVEKSTAILGHRRSIAALLAVNLAVVGIGFAMGYRGVNRERVQAPLDDIPKKWDGWQGEDRPIPSAIQELLTYDRALHRVYRNRIGHEVHVWIMFWSGSGSIRGYHHPDVCWPNGGWDVVRRDVRPIDWRVGATTPVTFRTFAREHRRQLICYWTQEGKRVWTDREEDEAHLEGTPGHRWIRERLLGEPLEESGRLSVLIGSEMWDSGELSEQLLVAFCRDLMRELYRAVPWAAP